MKKAFLLVFVLWVHGVFAKTTVPVSFQHEGLTLSGRLQIPDGNGRYPVIVIHPGSGSNDKNGTAPMTGANVACLYPGLLNDTLRPYLELSEALSDSGYAVFTYDKVEYTYANPLPLTFAKLWLPVKSAVAYLKTRNDIDTSQIVLLGHSEGSSIIPYIARSESGIKALISLAGPRRPIDTILAYQLVYIAQTCNGDVPTAQLYGDQILQYCGNIRSGNYTSSTPPLMGVPPDVWKKYLGVVDSVSINYNLAGKKTLFIGLGDDFNVPVTTEIPRFQHEITTPADFYIIPGLNHFITTPTDPSVSETLTDTIVHWLRDKIAPVSVKLLLDKHQVSVSVHNKTVDVSAEGATLRSVTIYDLKGSRLFTQQCNASRCSVALGHISSGVYIIEVVTPAGKLARKFAIY